MIKKIQYLLMFLGLIWVPLSWAGSYPVINYFMFTPAPGFQELFLGATTLKSEIKLSTDSEATLGSGNSYQMIYSLGLTPSFAFTVDQDILDNQTIKGSAVTKFKTYSPTSLGFKGFLVGNPVQIFYSLKYRKALFQKRDDRDGLMILTNEDVRDFGQAELGLALPLTSFISFGGRGIYRSFQKTENIFSSAVVQSEAGSGSEWEAFFQFNLGFILGASYGVSQIDKYINKLGSDTEEIPKSENKKMSVYGVGSIGPADLILRAQKTDLNEEQKKNYEKYDFVNYSFGIKFNF